MEIKFKKEELSKIADKIGRIVRRCDHNSVYNKIKMTVQKECVDFELRGGAFFLKTRCKCSAREEKDIVINARSFLDVISNIDAQNITLVEDDSGIVIIGGEGVSINIPLLIDTSFIPPSRPDARDSRQVICLKKDDLTAGITNCIPFESKTDSIVGVNFQQKENVLRLCCSTNTCGNLYYIKDIKTEKTAGTNFTLDTFLAGCINPLFSGEKELKLEIYNNCLYIETDTTNMALYFLNVVFPRVEVAIPAEFEASLPVNKGEFKRTVDLSEALLQGEEMLVEYREKELTIKCGEVTLATKTETRNNAKIKLNRNLLKKIIGAVKGDSFEFLYNPFPQPLIVKTEKQVLLLAPQKVN